MGWWGRDNEGGDRGRRRDDISTSELGRRLDDHIANSKEEMKDLKDRLDKHEEDSDKRHNENLSRFTRVERMQYLALGGATVIFWLISQLAHGLAK